MARFRRIQRRELIVLLVICLALIQFPQLKPVRDLLRQAVVVPARLLVNTNQFVKGNVATVRGVIELSKENALLKEQNADLLARLAQQEQTANENQQLRRDLNFAQSRAELKLIPAELLNYSPSGSYQAITINKGSADGVALEQAVITSGALLGKVKNVSEHTAEVWLVTNRNLAIPVTITSVDISGVLRGGIAGLIIDNIPAGTKIKQGDLVVTSALENLYPSGILVGTIEAVESRQEEVFTRARMSLTYNMANIKTVYVVQ